MKEPASKAGSLAKPGSWVRIPPSPPASPSLKLHQRQNAKAGSLGHSFIAPAAAGAGRAPGFEPHPLRHRAVSGQFSVLRFAFPDCGFQIWVSAPGPSPFSSPRDLCALCVTVAVFLSELVADFAQEFFAVPGVVGPLDALGRSAVNHAQHPAALRACFTKLLDITRTREAL